MLTTITQTGMTFGQRCHLLPTLFYLGCWVGGTQSHLKIGQSLTARQNSIERIFGIYKFSMMAGCGNLKIT